jgi:hypothetical protein
VRGVSIPFLFLILVSPFFRTAFAQSPDSRVKVAEGQYTNSRDGRFFPDSTQSWTLWRTADGFELEDVLPTDKAKALMAAALAGGSATQLSPELSEEIRKAAMPTDVRMVFSSAVAVRSMLLHGKLLTKREEVEIADCRVTDTGTSCKGRGNTVRLKGSAENLLAYSYPFPLMYRLPLRRLTSGRSNEATRVSVSVLTEVADKLELTAQEGQLQSAGSNDLIIGEHTFKAEKYELDLITKTGPRKITLWIGPQNLPFAMEDSSLTPGMRVLLTQFKKYSDF